MTDSRVMKELLQKIAASEESSRLAEIEAAERRAASQEDAAQGLALRFGLRSLLGLGSMQAHKDANVYAEGRIEVEGVEIDTAVVFSDRGFDVLVSPTLKSDMAKPVMGRMHIEGGGDVDYARIQIAKLVRRLLADIEEVEAKAAESRLRTEKLKKQMDEAEAAREQERAALIEKGMLGAVLLKDAASRYVAVQADQRAACAAWAESETKRLWAPWSGWIVNYVPIGLTAVDDAGDFERSALVVYDTAQGVALRSPGASVKAVRLYGEVYDLVIGSFVDGEMRHFGESATNCTLPYHRSKYVHFPDGTVFAVNVPPMNDAVAIDPPQVVEWDDFLAHRYGLNARSFAWFDAILRNPVEELAEWIARNASDEVWQHVVAVPVV